MNEKKHEKNYGIEWLRILSMYMVAVLHTLGQGGILGSFKQGDLSFSIAWFLETAAMLDITHIFAIKRVCAFGFRPFFTRLESLFYLPYLCQKLSQRINGLLHSFLS